MGVCGDWLDFGVKWPLEELQFLVLQHRKFPLGCHNYQKLVCDSIMLCFLNDWALSCLGNQYSFGLLGEMFQTFSCCKLSFKSCCKLSFKTSFGCSLIHEGIPQQMDPHIWFGRFLPKQPSQAFLSPPRLEPEISHVLDECVNHYIVNCSLRKFLQLPHLTAVNLHSTTDLQVSCVAEA